MSSEFIIERSNKQKLKIFTAALLLSIILIAFIVAFQDSLSRYSRIGSFQEAIKSEINNLSPAGLFYSGFFGGLFFLPIPQEAFFYYGLSQGSPPVTSALLVNAGFLLAQIINYFIGLKLGSLLLQFISKRKVYKYRRKLNKYGSATILVFNIFPLPASPLTFALGLSKYNIYRLFFYIIIGTAIKYSLMILYFIYF